VFEPDLSRLKRKPSSTSLPFLAELNIHRSTEVSANSNIENVDIFAPTLGGGLHVQALKLAVSEYSSLGEVVSLPISMR
jgi:hypothetical protein